MVEIKINKWNVAHAFVLSASSLTVIYYRSTATLSIVSLLSFSWFIISNIRFLKSYHPFAGHANRLTFFRLCCILLTGFFYSGLTDTAIAVLALIIIIMDGLDGYLARKFGSVSEWGAYFDMETDAFFVCMMSSIIYLKGYIGAWILLTGYSRYIYVVLLFLLRISDKKEKQSRFAQVIAGILFFSLITPFVLNESIYLPCVALASFLLIISFSRSFISSIKG
ncbi:MAG TPA: CDP-alcohol phosphatidyltransferase family protein [bacterium]|nr:CDP-alcohol phosphatidyltransferase family protein [bacterium]